MRPDRRHAVFLVLGGALALQVSGTSSRSKPWQAHVVIGDPQRRTRGVRGAQETTSTSPSSLPTPSGKSSSVISNKKVKLPPKSVSSNKSNGGGSIDFQAACVADLNQRASEDGRLTNVDYGTFLHDYCLQSARRGAACDPVGGATSSSSFISLPVQIQLLFAQPACSGSAEVDEYEQLQCLAALLERGDGVFAYDEEVEELCQATSALLVMTGMIVSSSPSPSSSPSSSTLTAPPSVVPTSPAQAPTLLPITMESSGIGSSPIAATTYTAFASPTVTPTSDPPAQVGPTSLQQSMEGGSGSWGVSRSPPSTNADSAASPPPQSSGRRSSAGPVAAAVLVGASLGGFLVTALWLRHRVQHDRAMQQHGKRRNDDGDDGDGGDLLEAGDSSIPSEYSSEIFLVEPAPRPSKSHRSVDRRSKKRNDEDSERVDREESEMTIEINSDVASDVTDALRTRNVSKVLPHDDPVVQSPLEYLCVRSSSSDPGESSCDILQLSSMSAWSHARNSLSLTDDHDVESPIQKAAHAPTPLRDRAVPFRRWGPFQSHFPREAAAADIAASVKDRQAPQETNCDESYPVEATETAADETAIPSVLKRIQQIEKEMTLSPQTPRPPIVRLGHVKHRAAPRDGVLSTGENVGDAIKTPALVSQSMSAVDDGPGDHFVLETIDSPGVTSDVSDADSAGDEDDDDWTEETVSVAHAEMEIGEILEDVIESDNASLEEEVIVEEFVPVILDMTPPDRIQAAWPRRRRRIEESRAPPPATLFLPPLVSEVDGAVCEHQIGAKKKRTVKEMIAEYDKSPTPTSSAPRGRSDPKL